MYEPSRNSGTGVFPITNAGAKRADDYCSVLSLGRRVLENVGYSGRFSARTFQIMSRSKHPIIFPNLIMSFSSHGFPQLSDTILSLFRATSSCEFWLGNEFSVGQG